MSCFGQYLITTILAIIDDYSVVLRGFDGYGAKDAVVLHGCSGYESKDGVVLHGCSGYGPKDGMVCLILLSAFSRLSISVA